MWPKYASARDFLHNAEEGKILHGKVIKKSPGRQPVHYHPGESIIFGKSVYLTILAIDATIVAKEAKAVA